MKKCIFLSLILFIAFKFVNAQTVNYYVGKPNDASYHETATCIRTLKDGSTIVAGHMYVGTLFTETNIIIMRLQGEAVLWSYTIHLPGIDQVTDMVIAQNGDILVVGYGHLNSSNTIKTPFVYRFDESGNLLHQYRFESQATVKGTVAYFGVVELASGRIVCVGTINPDDPNSYKGLISTFTSNLTLIRHDITDLPENIMGGYYDVFLKGNSEKGERVMICGSIILGNQIQFACLTDYIPPYSNTSGTYNWFYFYNFGDGQMVNSKFTQLHGFNVGAGAGRYVCNAIISDDINASISSRQVAFRCDEFGLNPSVQSLRNSNVFTNASRIYPYYYDLNVDDYHALITQHPDPAINDPIYKVDDPVFKGVLTDISSMNSHTYTFSSSLNIFGEIPSHNDVHAEQISGVYVSNSAGSSNTSFNGKEINYTSFEPILDSKYDCQVIDEGIKIVDLKAEISKLSPSSHELPVNKLEDVKPVEYPVAVIKTCGTNPISPGPCPGFFLTHEYIGPSPLGIGCDYGFAITALHSAGWTVESYELWTGGFSTGPYFTNLNSYGGTFGVSNTGTSVTFVVTWRNNMNQTCTSSLKLTLDCPSLLAKKGEETDDIWKVYPNPAFDRVSFETESLETSEVIIQLYDALGRNVQNRKSVIRPGTQKIELSLSDLSPGIYGAKIITENKTTFKQLIKTE